MASKHLIGNNFYDADMGDIETMVRFENNPDDILAQTALFNYYISKILSNWNATKEYIISDEFVSDGVSRSPIIYMSGRSNSGMNEGQNALIANFDNSTNILINYINDLTNRFNTDKKFYVDEIMSVFQYIADFSCGIINKKVIYSSTFQ